MARASSSISGGTSVKANGFPGNKTNMQKKGDYGVRVARWGYDASTCDDGDLLFNSSWPIVQIAKYIKPDASWESVELVELPEDEPYELDSTVMWQTPLYGVDRKYAYKTPGYRVYGYSEVVGTTEWGEDILDEHYFFKPIVYRARHNLGYIPMILNSELLSGGEVGGGVVLTNIDIEKDADYPYLSRPKIASTKVADYGIASKAYYASKLDTRDMRCVGLSSNIQSLMVQAIKTSKTTAKSGWGEEIADDLAVGSVVYYPPENNNKYVFNSDELTYFGFLGQVGGAIGEYSMLRSGLGDVGVRNTYRNLSQNINAGFGDVLFQSDVNMSLSGARIVCYKENEYSGEGPAPEEGNRKASIVCLRCPMVSPELIQVEV